MGIFDRLFGVKNSDIQKEKQLTNIEANVNKVWI